MQDQALSQQHKGNLRGKHNLGLTPPLSLGADNKLATALRMKSKYAGSEPTITYTKAYPTEIVTSRQSLQLYIHTHRRTLRKYHEEGS